tara:strand:+ start:701 stop:1474 length:774 start_codon:yes stop_codon:yes gene_type:complete
MIETINEDIIININKYLSVNDVLLLRKSFKNNFKILKEFEYVRLINPETEFFINKNDIYNIELNINDFMIVYNKNELLSNQNIISLNIIRTGICNFNKLDENFELKDLIYDLLCKNNIECLTIDIGYFYTLSNYFRKKKINITKLNIKILCLRQIYNLINPYWDLTLYSFKQIINTFKKLENIIYIDLKFSALFYNTYRLTASIVSIKNIENYNNINKKLKYFLKKNKINIDLNIKLNDRKYNLFFEEDDSFKLDFK